MKVVNVMKEEYDVDVTRSGKWGNPFSHKKGTWAKQVVATLGESIEKYREYLVNNEELMAALPELKNKTLGCWCPGPAGLTSSDKLMCHGQILLQLLEDEDEDRR